MTQESSADHALLQFLYQTPIGLLKMELNGEITMINPMAASLLMPLTDVGGLDNLFDLLAPYAPELRDKAIEHKGFGSPVGGMTLPIPVGEVTSQGAHPLTLGLRLVRLNAATWMATLSDITQVIRDEERVLNERLNERVRLDSLTGLPSRQVILEHIEVARTQDRMGDAHPFAVLSIDLDRFRRINAAHGQAVGDLLLQITANRLLALIAPGGPLEAVGATGLHAARLGIDEFAIVAQHLDDGDLVADISRVVLETLSAPYLVVGQTEHMTASVGVVLAGAGSAHAQSLLQDASIAMKEAKREGGGHYSLFDPAMKARLARQAIVETDLRGAIRRGELLVVYQPIVALPGRRCVGMEALVRWAHPVLGNVHPSEFVGIAEEIGIIREIGRFVLFEACRASAVWRARLGSSAPRSMSVNVSRAQLGDKDFASQVREALKQSGMRAADLQLEVTESLAAQDRAVQLELQDLRALGVTIALDDFGTGYSSLASLHLLPIDVLKIDRSFVALVESSVHHRVLIEAVLLVARSLGMRTVAEGIETEGQAAEITRLQCDKGQGYLYSQPLPFEAATLWLEKNGAETIVLATVLD